MNGSVSSSIGQCPYCGGEVAESSILIEYERTNDDPGIFAECSRCGEVVRPV